MNKMVSYNCLRKEKVVHIVPSFGCGGLEKVIVNLINNSEHYNVNHILISLTTDFELAKEINSPVDIYCLGKKPGNDVTSHFKLFKLLKKIKPTAFHTYNFGTIEYHLVAKLAGVATTVHCDHGRGGDDPKGQNNFNNFFRKQISRFIDHYIVVSYDLFKWVTEDLQISPSKVQLVFNGVSVEAEVPKKVKSKSVNHSEFIITTVGRIDPIKNQKLLLDAFELGKQRFSHWQNVKLQLVGNGPLFDELNRYTSTLNSKSDIAFLGFRSDVPEILAKADLFALSSFYEAMPMTILEAMAMKTPVITTNVGGISKFISEQHAWFVETDNVEAYCTTLNEIMSDEVGRHKKVSVAHQLVFDNYSMDKMVDTYMGLYKITEDF